MLTGAGESSMDREETIATLTKSVIAEFGGDASAVARKQADASAGEARATWTAILEAIEERDPQA